MIASFLAIVELLEKQIVSKQISAIAMQPYNQYSGTFGKKRRSEPPAIKAVIAKRKELRG